MTSSPASTPSRGALVLVQGLTLGRIPLALGFVLVAVFLGRSPWELFLGFALLGLIELSDLFDGMLARRLGVVTWLGQMLDPYSDSISRLMSYWTLAMVGLVHPLVPLIMALRDVTVAYCRIILAGSNRSVSARLGGKIKAAVQGVGGLLAWLGPVYWPWTGRWTIVAISAIVGLVTAWSALDYLRAAAPELRSRLDS